MLNAILFGATGATGSAIVDLLIGGPNAANYVNHSASIPEGTSDPKGGRHLTAFTRRNFLWPIVENASHPFGVWNLENHVIDFENMEETLAPKLADLQKSHGPIDVVFCAHGAKRMQVRDDETYLHLDSELVVEMARQAKAAGAKHFSLVSGAHASTDSLFLYSRSKAQTIEAIKAMQFERFSVFKPAMIVAKSRPDPPTLESIAVAVSPFLSWVSRATGFKSLKVLESIDVEDLAASMIANAMRPSPTNTGYEEYETAPDILALKHKTL